jgi:hypothetical protein
MVEIFGSSCFYLCKSLASISIDSGSLLQRIEFHAFFSSYLTFILIPRIVKIVDGSAFSFCKQLLISIEERSEHLFVDGYFLQNFNHSILIRYFGREDIVCIPRTVEIIGSSCFRDYNSLSSVSFESNSLLWRIEPYAFDNSSLSSIIILCWTIFAPPLQRPFQRRFLIAPRKSRISFCNQLSKCELLVNRLENTA